MSNRPDFALAIGESLIDVVPTADGPAEQHVGGSPLNVAVGLARLDRPVRFATRYGDDERGRLIADHLTASGVDIVAGSDGAGRTSTATVSFDGAGSAHYTFDLEWQAPPLPADAAPLVVHTGSIGATVQPGAGQVLGHLRDLAGRSTVTFDPNIRPAVIGARQDVVTLVEQFLLLSDVVKASDEDLAWLYPEETPHRIARAWLRYGPSIVVVTSGADGALLVCRDEQLVVPAPRLTIPLADTIGAGDAFMAGLIDGLWSLGVLGGDRRAHLAAISREQLGAVAAHATKAAGVDLARPGADPAWRRELPAACWGAAR